MRMDFCSLPHMRTLITLLCAAFALTVLCRPAAAHDGRTHNNGAKAELHINVVIVPVVVPPRHHERDDRNEAAVTYHLAPPVERLSVMEEVRPMLVDVDGNGAQQEPVRLTTVVVK